MEPQINDTMAENITTNAFDSDWNATDIANLQPGHLARTKPVRGWDRKPASPFAKQRMRVGKVWKRAFPPLRTGLSNGTGQGEEPTTKRIRAGQSPVKIVKRLCLGANHSVGSQWDKLGSPTKRIVTRSTAADNLVALPDEDEDTIEDLEVEEDAEGTVVEILDEEGRVLDLDAEEAQEDENWSDVDAPGDEAEEPFDDTMLHLGEAANHELVKKSGPTQLNQQDQQDTIPTAEVADIAPAPLFQSGPLPAGFVSPVRRKRPVPRRLSTKAGETDRRRTLPRTFAPLLSEEDEHQNASDRPSEDMEEANNTSDPAANKETVNGMQEETNDTQTSGDIMEEGEAPASDDDAWEDVPAEAEPSSLQADNLHDTIVTSVESPRQQTPMDQPLSPTTQIVELPLRRSPRRKSSSPLKQRAFKTFVDATPHLVAFSPFKMMSEDGDHMRQHEDINEDKAMHDAFNSSPLVLERSVSAPPEEPQMSPRRSAKPRVSDDTALLQAFLNRAAENKSSRRLSVTKRESLSNRRDSDTVRQALASPAKPEILGTLDPNSPSPKKALAASDDAKLAEDEEMAIVSPVETSGENENTQGRPTRRSHRDKRRVERAAPLAHTRISLRGNTDPVVLKRSEAQELATTTRSNTRKNKGGSIMPTLRLTKLIVEQPPIETSTQDDAENLNGKPPRPGVRNVQWDQTLVYFQEAPSEPDVPLFELGDSNTAPKLQVQPQNIPSEPDSDDAVPQPPPAAETPSKPKVRKLRAPRTASTPGKLPTAPINIAELAPPAPSQRQPRRSRIATPAKGLDASSLLPADVAPAPSSESTARPKAVPRKKATSRLPAPAVPTAPTDNQSIIASPPKKKSTTGTLQTKNPTPKLDFQTKLSAPSKPADDAPQGNPGLMSPAKRGGKSVAFGNVPPGPSFGAKADSAEDKRVPGLNSPAKKRTRRAM